MAITRSCLQRWLAHERAERAIWLGDGREIDTTWTQRMARPFSWRVSFEQVELDVLMRLGSCQRIGKCTLSLIVL